jgi:hypothetical protein
MADTSPKKKVAAKPTKPAAHPKYSEMVGKAIAALKERGGSSRQAILKFGDLVAFFAGLAAGFFAAAGFLAFGFAAFFSAAGFFAAVFFGVRLRNQQLIQNTAKWLVKQLLH